MEQFLLDKNFLKEIDDEHNKEIYAKIVSLNIHEEPVESIEGKVTAGSIQIDGASAVRRSCSLTLVAEDVNLNDFYWGFSNKFKLYIGIVNTINKKYPDILWFPQGTFVINSFSSAVSINTYTISISGQDKMCLLNGTIGGNIPATHNFSTERVYADDGSYTKEKRDIRYIVREMIHEYGNEPFHNIVIRDLEDSGLEMLDYKGTNDIYILRYENGEYGNIIFDGNVERYMCGTNLPIKLNSPAMTYYALQSNTGLNSAVTPTWLKDEKTNEAEKNKYQVIKCTYGEAAGYRMCELVWPGKEDLIASPGDTVTSILDKIVNTFGDYEYFYNLDGQFVFQKKLTYLNTSWNTMIRHEDDEQYIESEKMVSQYSYSFSNAQKISNFKNTPNLTNIKNDYAIWGKKKTSSGKELDIHLRYGIQDKPTVYTTFDGETYHTAADAITYEKKPNPPGLSEDWWAVDDWAEFYKLYTGTYPKGTIGTYCVEGGTYIDLNNIFKVSTNEALSDYYRFNWGITEGSYGKWFTDYTKGKIYIFDVLPDGSLGYLGHRDSCSHSYQYFLDMKQMGITCYIYKPLIPTIDTVRGMVVDWRELIYRMAKDNLKHQHDDDFEVVLARNNPQYKYGITGYESYYADMLAFWRILYNPWADMEDNSEYNPELYDPQNYYVGEHLNQEELENYGWNKLVVSDPTSLIFWIDLLDPKGGELSQYTISAIGIRTKAVNDTDVKSIVYKEIPSLIYVSPEKYQELAKGKQFMTGYTYVQLAANFEDQFSITPRRKSAHQVLDELMYQFVYTSQSINITNVPIYYLEPNTKILVHDEQTGIAGDYIIDKISLSLKHDGQMQITASKAPVRLY